MLRQHTVELGTLLLTAFLSAMVIGKTVADVVSGKGPGPTSDASTTDASCRFAAGTTLSQCSFEFPTIGDLNLSYRTPGSVWNFSGLTGIASNHSAFTGTQSAPDGEQVAFIQIGSTFSQTIDGFVSGSYTLTFSATQRRNIRGHQDFMVLLDDHLLGAFEPSSTAYEDFSVTFAATPGKHTLTFKGLNTAGGDNSAFIDDLRLVLNP